MQSTVCTLFYDRSALDVSLSTGINYFAFFQPISDAPSSAQCANIISLSLMSRIAVARLYIFCSLVIDMSVKIGLILCIFLEPGLLYSIYIGVLKPQKKREDIEADVWERVVIKPDLPILVLRQGMISTSDGKCGFFIVR